MSHLPAREPEPQTGRDDSVSGGAEDVAQDRQRTDRRTRPTRMFSRYTLFGRRRRNRRDTDPSKRYYIDRIDGRYLKALIAVLTFIVVDAFSTLHIIQNGGGEANPLMAWVLERGTGWFVTLKICTALTGFLLLAVHRFFPVARWLATLLLLSYGGIVLYHVYLLLRIHF